MMYMIRKLLEHSDLRRSALGRYCKIGGCGSSITSPKKKKKKK